MRHPRFNFIDKFYVQSIYGLKIDEKNILPFGSLLDVSLEPIRLRRFYNCGLIGSFDQVARHGRNFGINLNPVLASKLDRDDALIKKETKSLKTKIKR